MGDEQVGADAVGHGQRGPHAVEARVGLGALDDAAVGTLESLAELVEQDALLAAARGGGTT